MNDKRLLTCFKFLSSEAKELYLRNDVPEIDHPISPMVFFRDWVCPNLPVVIKNGVKHWPAVKKWTNKYLREKFGEKVIEVAATPNGYADALNDGYFVMPEELKMTFGDFLDVIENPDSLPGTILYIQSQNSNFGCGEWAELACDTAKDLDWATEAFGEGPSNANFWMGDQRAVTSMHRDPFENIYCVVRGYKDFILHPPTDLPWIPYQTRPCARYQSVKNHRDSPRFEIVPVATIDADRKDKNSVESTESPQTEEIKNSEETSIKQENGNSHDATSDNKIKNSEETSIKEENGNSHDSTSDKSETDDESESEDSETDTSDSESAVSLTERLDRSRIPWICIDPLKPDLDSYPLYANATEIRVRVHAGDVLFLPVHWFHHVRQSHGSIAINYWYDMKYDHRYAHQAFITALLRKSGLNTGCPAIF